MNKTKFETFKNGSKWLRADFHLHTKADKEFSYNGEDDQYINNYISKLQEENIKVGVITNHNKFDLHEFKILRKEARKKEMFLFPGVELSVTDGSNGVHCLIVFDYDTWYINKKDHDHINQFLSSAFEGIENFKNENINCKYGLNGLLKTLEDHKKKGRDSFIIMAHVEEKKGFVKEFGGNRIEKYSEDELFRKIVLGFQKVRSHDDVKKLNQWLDNKLPAFVEGSDCKDIDTVGSSHIQGEKAKKTFIKLGDFNFPALKFAFLDKEHKIKKQAPEPQNAYIKSITFRGAKLNGQTLYLNPNMNNLIGIRGSGKSTILEAIRYVLDIEFPNKARDVEYKYSLMDNLLGSGGKIILNIVDKHNNEYKITKIKDETASYCKNGEDLDSTIDINEFITPLYYGQKDLSAIGEEGFSKGLVDQFFGYKAKDIRNKIETKKENIEETISELETIDNKKEELDTLKKRKNTLKIKMEAYEENNIDKKLKKQTQFNKDLKEIKNIIDLEKDYLQEIEKVNQSYLNKIDDHVGYSSEFNNTLFEYVNLHLKEFKDRINEIDKIIKNQEENKKTLIEKKTQLKKDKDDLKEDFAEIRRKIDADNLEPDDYLKFSKELGELNENISESEKICNEEEGNEKKLKKQLQNIQELWNDEFNRISSEIENLNKKELSIRIKSKYKGNKKQFHEFIKNFVQSSGLRSDTLEKITDNYKDTIEIYFDLYDKNSKLADILSGGSNLHRFKEKIENNLKDFLTFRVPDDYILYYKDKKLAKHSLGQRASAVIIFLLTNKENDLIIIDQPEDDLDNKSIYNDVITELINLKNEIQFIFATHNPNIPVLGDSEQIFSCNYYSDELKIDSGSIDNSKIQKEIVDIMEGGPEAFQKRKEIYISWDYKSN